MDFEEIKQDVSYENYRIDSVKPRKPIEPLLYIQNKVVLSRSNISIVSGQGKSRKTFFMRAVIKALITSNWCGIIDGVNSSIVWFDTEQSQGHAGRVYDSIVKETGIQEPFDMFALRGLSASEMIQVIETYLNQNKRDFIILDGVGDLIEQANNELESTKLVNFLMDHTMKNNNHICMVLHVNYDTPKLRGHIGSALERKCEHTFLLSKDGKRTDVKPKLSRGEDYEPFYFTIEDGFPTSDFCIPQENRTIKTVLPNAPSKLIPIQEAFNTTIETDIPF